MGRLLAICLLVTLASGCMIGFLYPYGSFAVEEVSQVLGSGGTYKGTMRDPDKDAVTLLADPRSEWKSISVVDPPAFDGQGDMCQIPSTNAFLYYWDNISYPLWENYTYYLFDKDAGSWTVIEEGADGFSVYTDMVPIYGTEKVLIKFDMFGKIGLIFKMYDHSTGVISDVADPPHFPFTDQHYSVLSPIYGTNQVLMFGGVDGSSWTKKPLNETWIFDADEESWTQLFPKMSPSARFDQGMAPLQGTDQVILFGGNKNETWSDETWIFDLSQNEWTRLLCKNSPLARAEIDLTPIPGKKSVLLFGGASGESVLGDTWLFNGSDWKEIHSDEEPARSDCCFMAETKTSGEVLMWNERDYFYIFYPNYYASQGVYRTEPIYLGNDVLLKRISLDGVIPELTSIEYQLRTGSSINNIASMPYLGPNRSNAESFKGLSSDPVWNLTYDGWVQICFVMQTDDKNATPELRRIHYEVSRFPNVTTSEQSMGTITRGPFSFEWSFSDPENDDQMDVEIAFSKNDEEFLAEKVIFLDDYGEFSYSGDRLDLPDGLWHWRVKVRDCDGAWSRPSHVRSFRMDSASPVTSFLGLKEGELLRCPKYIEGQALDQGDGSGIDSVWVCICDYGRLPVYSEWRKADGLRSWNYSIDKDLIDGKYSLYSKAIDKAGNEQKVLSILNFTIDRTPPKNVKVSINGGSRETNNTNVTLSLYCEDPAGPIRVSMSEDNATWTDWIEYVESCHFNLSDGNGLKSVYFKAMDSVGNIADTVFDTIVLNITSPSKEEVEEEGGNSMLFYLSAGIGSIVIIVILITIIIVFMVKRKRKNEMKITQKESHYEELDEVHMGYDPRIKYESNLTSSPVTTDQKLSSMFGVTLVPSPPAISGKIELDPDDRGSMTLTKGSKKL